MLSRPFRNVLEPLGPTSRESMRGPTTDDACHKVTAAGRGVKVKPGLPPSYVPVVVFKRLSCRGAPGTPIAVALGAGRRRREFVW